jgi:lipopolysaccharide export system protein LptA
MHLKSANLILAILLAAFLTNGYALDTDKNEAIHVDADNALFTQQTHKGIYTGNVTLVQGTTNLTAHKAMTLGNEKNNLILAEAYGNGKEQAHYWTKTAVDKPVFHAYADTIRYYPEKHYIELIGHAKVMQGDNVLTAPMVRYDTLTQEMVSQKTSILIHPEKKKL